jgi:hypothetical protein
MEFRVAGSNVVQKVGQVTLVIMVFALWSHSQPVLVLVPTHAPAANTDWLSQFLGFWESEDKLDGQPRITIELRLEDGKPAGTFVIRGVQGDYDPNSLTLPIREAKLQTASLSFETDPGQDGIMQWTLSIMSDDKVLLSAVRDDFEIPKYVMQRPSGH